MEFLNQILAGVLNSFKAKNPKIFAIVVVVLVLGYVGVQTLVAQGIMEATSLSTQILQYIDIAMLTLVGAKTAPFLSEYLNQGGSVQVQQTSEDNWWSKLLDGFKLKSPVAYGIIAVVLLSTFAGITYAIQFGLIPEGNSKLFLQVASYVELAGLILLGSRTGQYIIDNPPTLPEAGSVNMQSASNAALYYD